MEKQIYYNETIFIESTINTEEPVEIYLNYDLTEDSCHIDIPGYNLNLKQLEKFAKDLLKFVNEIKKDNK